VQSFSTCSTDATPDVTILLLVLLFTSELRSTCALAGPPVSSHGLLRFPNTNTGTFAATSVIHETAFYRTCMTLMGRLVSLANCSRMCLVGLGVCENAVFSISSCFALMVVLGPRRFDPELPSSGDLFSVWLSLVSGSPSKEPARAERTAVRYDVPFDAFPLITAVRFRTDVTHLGPRNPPWGPAPSGGLAGRRPTTSCCWLPAWSAAISTPGPTREVRWSNGVSWTICCSRWSRRLPRPPTPSTVTSRYLETERSFSNEPPSSVRRANVCLRGYVLVKLRDKQIAMDIII